jgi:peptidoglycan/LPS O-acetylase OafA/YrhL
VADGERSAAGGASEHVPALDGVRGAALLSVMALHTVGPACGWVGLLFFFVLSGFLITRGLLARRGLPARAYYLGFYRRRAARILPLYFLWLLVVALVFHARREPPRFVSELPYLVTFTTNFARVDHAWVFHPLTTHLWSLAVEEQFYLVWPLVVRLLDARRLERLCLSLVVLAPISRLVAGLCLDDGLREDWVVADTVYQLTTTHADAFALGALVALITRRAPETRLFARALAPSLSITGLAGAIVLSHPGLIGLEALPRSSLGYPLAPRLAGGQHLWAYTLLDLCAAALIGLLVSRARSGWRAVRWFFSLALLRELGRVSYGMYIVHWGLAWLLWQTTGLPPLRFGRYLVAVYVLGYLSQRFFEGPILRRFGRQAEAESA